MKRPAKKRRVTKTNKGVLGAVIAGVAGVAAGAAAMFLSSKENRETVKKVVNKTVKKGKTEVLKAEKAVLKAKKKAFKK